MFCDSGVRDGMLLVHMIRDQILYSKWVMCEDDVYSVNSTHGVAVFPSESDDRILVVVPEMIFDVSRERFLEVFWYVVIRGWGRALSCDAVAI